MEVNVLNKETENCAHLYLPVFIADKIGLYFGKLLTKGLWILDGPYTTPGYIGVYVTKLWTCFRKVN